jgi:hypothetical protein
MSSRDTYNSSVKSAVASKVANDLADEVSRQTTIDAQLTAVGYTLQSGSYSALKTAVDNAKKNALANGILREQMKQASIMVARDLLRDSGDRSPF